MAHTRNYTRRKKRNKSIEAVVLQFPDVLDTGRLHLLRLCAERGDALLDLWPKVAHETLDGPRGGVAERADGMTLDLAAELVDHVDLVAVRLASDKALHHIVEPGGALAARRALAAALVLVKGAEARDGLDHVRRLVHYDDGGGAEAALDLAQGVKVHQHSVADGAGEHGDRGAAGDDALEVVPAANDAAAMPVNQLLEGDRHRL